MKPASLRRFAIAVLFGALLWQQWTRVKGAPFQPSNPRAVRTMLRLSAVRPGETVYDLGSGDGRVLIEAVRAFDAYAVGIEVDPARALLSRLRVAALGLGDRVRVRRADFLDVDISEADVVVCFLTQWGNDMLVDKLRRELAPGARIVSNRWTFPDLTLIAEDSGAHVRVYQL